MAQPELNLPILFVGAAPVGAGFPFDRFPFDRFANANANGRSGIFASESDIYNFNEKFWLIGRCLFNATQPPVTTEEVFIFSSSCDKHDKAVIYR